MQEHSGPDATAAPCGNDGEPYPDGDTPVVTTPPDVDSDADARATAERLERRRAKKLRRKAERAEARALQELAGCDGAAASTPTALTAPDAPVPPGKPEKATDPSFAAEPGASARTRTERRPRVSAPPQAPAAAEESEVQDSGFAAFGLRPALLAAIASLEYGVPTPVQAETIPLLLTGHDVIGQAQTGTGKTAAFVLPLLQRLSLDRPGVQALILEPTRELANQVSDVFRSFSRYLGRVGVLAIYGGQPIEVQLRALQRDPQIVVGTPGRVIDHLKRGTLSLAALNTVILDEADEMLRMGFMEDVEWILAQAPAETPRQTALFSATLPPSIRRVAERYLHKPVTVEIEPSAPVIGGIEQRFTPVPGARKLDLLCRVLDTEDITTALIFTTTKVRCADLTEALGARGFPAEALNGDLSQPQRDAVLRRLRSGKATLVVATDVAARGLDVDSISHVINFDMPANPESYVHRIGRTGRAGRRGVSLLFVMPSERRMLSAIERFTGERLHEQGQPTKADVNARRAVELKAALVETLTKDDLEPYHSVVEEVAREQAVDMVAVAAAAAHLARGDRPLTTPAERFTRAPNPAGQQRGMVALFLAVGHRCGVRPGTLATAIAEEAGVREDDVGTIDIGEWDSIVEVQEQHARQILDRMAASVVRGKPIRIRLARSSEYRSRLGRQAAKRTERR